VGGEEIAVMFGLFVYNPAPRLVDCDASLCPTKGRPRHPGRLANTRGTLEPTHALGSNP